MEYYLNIIDEFDSGFRSIGKARRGYIQHCLQGEKNERSRDLRAQESTAKQPL